MSVANILREEVDRQEQQIRDLMAENERLRNAITEAEYQLSFLEDVWTSSESVDGAVVGAALDALREVHS